MENTLNLTTENNKVKKIFYLILLVNVYINTFAQSGSENMLKYWHYRNRLQYFVIPSTKRGESEMLSERNTLLANVGSGSCRNISNIINKINLKLI